MFTESVWGQGLAAVRAQLLTESGGATALTRHCLDLINKRDVVLQSMVFVDRAGALARAAELDAMIVRGDPPLPLHGIPVVVKEIFSVAGMPDSAGTKIDVADLIEPEGAFVRQLRASGCVILGKSMSTEFAFGQYNLGRAMPLNPCDVAAALATGGSSSGSAAAMAAGYCGFAVGTDTGGSVRVPAALCGLVGFKPTAGTWPCDGIFPLAAKLDVPGFFAATVNDMILIHEALGGTTVDRNLVPAGLRIAVPRQLFFEDLEPAVELAIERILSRLAAAGYELMPVDFPDLSIVQEFFAIDVARELLERLGVERFEANRGLLDPLTCARFDALLASREQPSVAARLPALQRAVVSAMEAVGCKFWLSPAAPCVAPPHAQLASVESVLAWQCRVSRNTRIINALDMPACSIPVPGCASPGRPIGIQLAGVHGGDAALLELCAELERELQHE